jgi:hypothetical protein
MTVFPSGPLLVAADAQRQLVIFVFVFWLHKQGLMVRMLAFSKVTQIWEG